MQSASSSASASASASASSASVSPASPLVPRTPPSSIDLLLSQLSRSFLSAVSDGHILTEVEFPPLPSEVLEMDDVSAYDVSRENVRLAVEFARGIRKDLQGLQGDKGDKGDKICIMVPDRAELDIGVDMMGGDIGGNDYFRVYGGIELRALRGVQDDGSGKGGGGAGWAGLFSGAFGSRGTVNPVPDCACYIICIASAQELPDVEELYSKTGGKVPIVFFNLKLDTLRGDLGIPAFPPKSLHDRFLSRVKPVYYLRTRQYSRTTASPPFVVNYQGCLFRSYPGEWCVLLDVGDGRFRTVQESGRRPGLGEFKGMLNGELEKRGVVEEEGKTLKFLRTGYKTQTWWEAEREVTDGASVEWRT